MGILATLSAIGGYEAPEHKEEPLEIVITQDSIHTAGEMLDFAIGLQKESSARGDIERFAIVVDLHGADTFDILSFWLPMQKLVRKRGNEISELADYVKVIGPAGSENQRSPERLLEKLRADGISCMLTAHVL